MLFIIFRIVTVRCRVCLGDQYTGLGAQTLAPEKQFSSFLFSVVFQQKMLLSSDQWSHNASDYFGIA